MPDFDVDELVTEYDLPPLPDEDDTGPEARVLVLFRQDDTNVVLTNPVALADAMNYCNREDTHGDGWFVGFNRPNDYRAGDAY